jgi:hypothetical protein
VAALKKISIQVRKLDKVEATQYRTPETGN